MPARRLRIRDHRLSEPRCRQQRGRNASAEASYPRLLLIIGILLAMSQCQRGGIVSVTTIIEVLERAQALNIPVPQYVLAEQADSTLGAFMVPV